MDALITWTLAEQIKHFQIGELSPQSVKAYLAAVHDSGLPFFKQNFSKLSWNNDIIFLFAQAEETKIWQA